ncbi:BTAD domain-containing putative transcriptional regulator [Saccharothrix violaceirubra]|uniref:DNA-binding SARP family transcriptional activator/TolA-binding protein n=1 Tax=Saccharothrix violaceirubra TaxID=413306 RepID=A0A7W7WWI0_9PSEU|nr:BTAD domain-containing putative transcriptional regulator [Saccharothrix violaceirubra]MBB4965613.1 DNA-binding SARP family transcriptional activator/TolA-binding protein [Saccharothrix violaceirubra]
MTGELRVLGQVEVLVDGTHVDLGHARQRCVLAVLAVEANRVVPTDQVVDRVWGDHPPRRARQLVSNYLSLLRRLLAGAGVDGVAIERRGGGYVLLVDPRRVDLHRFRRLVADARAQTDQARALELFEQATAAWRGEALAGLDTPWIATVREGLVRERFAADTDRLDLALRLGRHTALLPELTGRADAHPLDERVAAQLMLALYRAGRPTEALDHYRRLHARLTAELGTDPGPDLRKLHQDILTAAPTLTGTPPGRASVTPRQLPSAPALFTGRRPELAELDHTLATTRDDPETTGTVLISAIGGVGGVGKTWLALTWAHRNLDRFPDGQLFVDLQGFSPTNRPTEPADAIRGFLTALGTDPARLPADLDTLAADYRSMIAGRRVLVVLDNAATAEQVIPLLPGHPSCTVLVTGRTGLASLIDRHGARHLSLDVLTRDEARALLARRLGDRRIQAEPDVTDDLIDLCGRHPLALAITARHAATRPRVPLAEFATELRDLGLDALDDDDPAASLPTVLSWSLRHLTDRQRTLFVLIGIAPGPDIDLPAAAALIGLSKADTRKILHALENHSLLDRHPRGRYAMHDLVRAYATADDHLTEPARQAALDRVVDFYLHTAYAADRHLNPHRQQVTFDPPATGVHPHPLPDLTAVLDWLDVHHPHLLAAQSTAETRRRHQTVWNLAWTLGSFHWRRGHRRDALTVWQAARTAAEHLPDPNTRILAHRRLGNAHAEMEQHEQAMIHLYKALTLAEHHQDPAQQANAQETLAWAWARQGDDRKALEHEQRALAIYRTLGNPVWEAEALNSIGWYAARIGDYDTARDHCEAALSLNREHDNPDGEATTLDSLGYIDYETGNHREAIDHYHQALTLYRELGDTTNTAETLDRLGHPHAALGHHTEAREAWQEALDHYRRLGRDTDAEQVRKQLDDLTEPQ